METTDELFCNTMRLLCDTNKPRNDFLKELKDFYINKIGRQYLNQEDKINYCFLDEYRSFIQEDLLTNLIDLLDKKKYISYKIQQGLLPIFLRSQWSFLLTGWQ